VRPVARSVLKTCPQCGHTYPGGEMFCPADGTRLSGTAEMAAVVPGQDPLLGVVLADRYKIVRRVGEGGMGVVYEAEHVVIEKRIAIKVLRDDYTKRPEVAARFRQEARSASRIGHENIVDVTDFGTTPSGGVFFVMEYLEGEDLADLLRRERTVELHRGIHIMLQVCRALSAAHAKGIIHRDLKPENIFLVERNALKDFAKILDFGIAKISEIDDPANPGEGVGRRLTKTGMIFGTPEYMSPEQAAGKSLDHRVDIYATGVILYEIYSGRVPFMGDTFMGVLTQHLFEAPPPMRTLNPMLRIPPALEAVIFKALAKDPDRRHQTMQELLDDIERAMKNPDALPLVARKAPTPVPVASLPPPTGAHVLARTQPDLRGSRAASRSRAPALLIGIGLVVGIGAAAAFMFGRDSTAADGDDETTTASPDLDPLPPATGEPSVDGLAGSTTTAPGTSAPTGEAPPDEVEITVETYPAGATVTVDGRGEVCTDTPCSFRHPRGQELSLHARRGRTTATKVLTPEESLTIDLGLGGTRGGGGRGKTTGKVGGGGGGGASGDLKIPTIWQQGGR